MNETNKFIKFELLNSEVFAFRFCMNLSTFYVFDVVKKKKKIKLHFHCTVQLIVISNKLK